MATLKGIAPNKDFVSVEELQCAIATSYQTNALRTIDFSKTLKEVGLSTLREMDNYMKHDKAHKDKRLAVHLHASCEADG